MPQDNSSKKDFQTIPGVYIGRPGVPAEAVILNGALRPVRTMKEDALLAKKAEEEKMKQSAMKGQPSSETFFTTAWSKISGKVSDDAIEETFSADKLQYLAKERAEAERVRTLAEAEVAESLVVKKAQAEKEKEAERLRVTTAATAKAKMEAELAKANELKIAEEKALALKKTADDALFAKVAVPKPIPVVPTTPLPKETPKAPPEAPLSPETISLKNRILAGIAKKAAGIMSTQGKALAEKVAEANEIIEEKEKIRNTMAKIVEAEERALSEVTKLVEKEERERVETLKAEATRKRIASERTADTAEATLIRERKEAEQAEQTAKKERDEAVAAEIAATRARTLAKDALEAEAKEIAEADKQVQMAVETAVKEVANLQKQVRSEAEAIAGVQKTAREAETAEINAVGKQTHADIKTV